MNYCHHYNSPIGGLTIVSDGEYLLGILFGNQRQVGQPVESSGVPIVEETTRWLDIYFSGKNPGFTPKLKFSGTPFQEEVWTILQTIPYGHTMTYGEIAKIISERKGMKRMSAQAVGNAVGHNPLPIVVPCHRVIGANGKLVGYGGGLDKKIALLELENNKL